MTARIAMGVLVLLGAGSACARPPRAIPLAQRRTLGMVCGPKAASTCPGRCARSARSRVGYCSIPCGSAASCPAGWRCEGAGTQRLCRRGPALESDVVAQFLRRYPGARGKEAAKWYRWYQKERGSYEAELMAQIFVNSGFVVIPVSGRHWERSYLEDVLFFVRLFPEAHLHHRFYRLERSPVGTGAGRTVPERRAVVIFDNNFGVHGTFLHEMGHVLDHLRTGKFDGDPVWRALHGWKRAPKSPTGWRKIGKDCTNGYGTIYGLPGQEFADEQWNYVRYGCAFRRCSRDYYRYLREQIYKGWCYCSEDTTCHNANPFQ